MLEAACQARGCLAYMLNLEVGATHTNCALPPSASSAPGWAALVQACMLVFDCMS